MIQQRKPDKAERGRTAGRIVKRGEEGREEGRKKDRSGEMSTTVDTSSAFADVWESIGSHWLPDDMRALICRTIMHLPAAVADFAICNCSFISADRKTKGQTYAASIFTHFTNRGRTMRNHWVIVLDESLLKNEQDGQYTVAHQIAHAWLGHRVMDGNFLTEEHADKMVKAMGLNVPKYRLKVHVDGAA